MAFKQTARYWLLVAGLVGGVNVAPAPGQTNGYESLPSFAAGKVLPMALQRSNYHTIVGSVQNDGFLNIYRMKTRSGEYEVVGTELLKLRILEAEAAAKLAEISTTDQALKSAGRTVTKPLKTGKDLITQPGATVKRTFRGVGRFFGRVGAGLDATDPQREGTIASITGASEAKRRLAYKFGVDPYTQFEPLSEQLSRLAGASALVGTATGVGMALVSGGAGVAISVGATSENFRALLRDKTAAELEKLGRNELAGMGVSRATIDAFYRNSFLTPSDKAIIIYALKSLGSVADRSVFVTRAAYASSSPYAFALRRRIELAVAYHTKFAPIISFVSFGGVPMMRSAKGIVAIFPIDYLSWTKQVAEMTALANQDKAAIAPKAPVEFWITGWASKRTAANLDKLGWRLVQNAGIRLGN